MRRISVVWIVCGLLTSAGVAWGSGIRTNLLDPSAAKSSAPSHLARGSRRKTSPRSQLAPQSRRKTSTQNTTLGSMLFGRRAVAVSVGRNGAGMAQAFPFRSGVSGRVSSISVYLDRRSHAITVLAGVFSNAGGRPNVRLASGSVASAKPGAWNSAQVRPAAIRSGLTYWLVVLGKGGPLYFRHLSSGACTARISYQKRLVSLPHAWKGGTRAAMCPISAFVRGTTRTRRNAPIRTISGTGGSDGSGSGTGGAGAEGTTGTLGATTSTTATTPTLPVTLPPVNVLPPTISGSPTEGEVLSTSDGTWLDSPTSDSYQWQDCDGLGSTCSDIRGATSSTYTLQSSDVGHTIDVVVTASNSAGAASSTSAQTGTVATPPPPSNTGAPTISGTAQQGQELSGTSGTWSNSPTSYAYQWQDCDSSGSSCSNISGAASSSFTLRSADVGHTIVVVVSATNAGGSASSASAPTSVVTGAPPSDTAAPAITGTAQQGQVLSASNGTWTNSPTSYAYQWQDCNSSGSSCSNISAATSSSFTLRSADVSHTIDVVVTATNGGGSTPSTSSPTPVVTPLAPVNSGAPVVSGSAQQGQVLSASSGTWSNSPSSYGYQWEDCNGSGSGCSNIGGATSSSYTLKSADVGDTVVVVVTATNAGGSASSASSATSVVTAAAPVNTGAPTVSGTAQQGQVLSASTGMWSNSPSSYGYQWQDCNSSGSGCANISGATSSTYSLQSSDVGDTVDVVVTASNAGGSGSATSAVTAVVSASGGGGGSGGGSQIYLAQSAAGAGNGADCGDAKAVSFFNSSANWGSGSGKIGPGVTVDLCGTISTGLEVQGSGTAGNPITVYWEPGATMSAPTWSTQPNGAAISTDNNSYLTFNGGNNGASIQATKEGTDLQYQGVDNTGIWAGGATSDEECNNCTFENLTIANLYVHTSTSDQSLSAGQVCAICWSGSNVTIANNTIHDGLWVLQGAWNNNDSNNYIYGNNVYNVDHGLAIAPLSGHTLTGIYIYDNHFHDYSNWDTGDADVYHHDGIHCFGDKTDIYHGLYIFDNRFDGTMGENATGQIFMEGNTGTPCSGVGSSVYMFNNLVTSSDNPPANGYFGTAAIQGAVDNNTTVGVSSTSGQCMGYGYEIPGQTIAFEDNLMSTCDQVVNDYGPGGSTPEGAFQAGSPDYNVYANSGSSPNSTFNTNNCSYNFNQFSSWQSCLKSDSNFPGWDQHSITAASADLNSDLSLASGSPATGAGANLTSVCNSLPSTAIPQFSGGADQAFCTTYTGPPLNGTAGTTTAGSPRPTTGPWNAGAY